jgi:hypothetical protein
MSRLSSLPALALLSSIAQLGCTSTPSSSSPNVTVTDSLGKRFTMSCGSSICSLIPEDTNLVARSCNSGYGTDAFALIWGRILTVHALTVSSYGAYEINHAEPARPVVCASDADCVPTGLYANGALTSFSCMGGLCQVPSQPLLTSDVIALCQADIPWPTACPYVTTHPFADRLAQIADTCGAEVRCDVIPPACRQLDAPVFDGGGAGPGLDGGERDTSGILLGEDGGDASGSQSGGDVGVPVGVDVGAQVGVDVGVQVGVDGGTPGVLDGGIDVGP